MSAPSAAAEKYLNCTGNQFNIGGTYTAPTTGGSPTPASVTGGVNLDVQKGSLNLTYGVYDMTSNTDGGCYADVKTIRKATGSFTCAYIGSAPPVFHDGDLFAVVIYDPATTSVFQATVRFNNVAFPIINVTDGLIYSFDITSQGPISFTW